MCLKGHFKLLSQNDPDSEPLRTNTMSHLCLNSHRATQGPALRLQLDCKNCPFIVTISSVVKRPVSPVTIPPDEAVTMTNGAHRHLQLAKFYGKNPISPFWKFFPPEFYTLEQLFMNSVIKR